MFKWETFSKNICYCVNKSFCWTVKCEIAITYLVNPDLLIIYHQTILGVKEKVGNNWNVKMNEHWYKHKRHRKHDLARAGNRLSIAIQICGLLPESDTWIIANAIGDCSIVSCVIPRGIQRGLALFVASHVMFR